MDFPSLGKAQLLEAMLKAAGAGDLKRIASLSQGKMKLDMNYRNEEGWTALMLAARNGHDGVVKVLLQEGADPSLVNKSGQTAQQIAEFWNHQDVVKVFQGNLNKSKSGSSAFSSNVVNFFGNNPLNRRSEKRSDSEWLDKTLKDPSTKLILLSKLSPYVLPPSEEETKHSFCIFQYSQISNFIENKEDKPNVVFLGEEKFKLDPKSQRNDAVNDGSISNSVDEAKAAWFAVDVSHVDSSQIEELNGSAEILDSHVIALMSFNESEAGILAQARSMLAWHDRYKYCATCGSMGKLKEGGYKRICTKEDCRSHRGVHNTSYPRLDPVAIMLVIHPSGEKCLLGRQKRFPPGMYSCLAGFIEPGETIEDAVRREVKEESGIEVNEVRYHSSQPWPQPSQIMIGCHAWATSTEIEVDKDELEDARWFTKQDAFKAVIQGHKGYSQGGVGFFCPPKQAIAHQLIKAWATTSNL